MNKQRYDITEEEAKKLYVEGFWETLSFYEKVKFQLFQRRLCMPFSIFQEAMEKTLKRPVYTHEFTSSNVENLRKEFLKEKESPTLEEIINLIPKDNGG